MSVYGCFWGGSAQRCRNCVHAKPDRAGEYREQNIPSKGGIMILAGKTGYAGETGKAGKIGETGKARERYYPLARRTLSAACCRSW